MVTYDQILKILAPCGLSCRKCMAFAEGEIKGHAQALKRLLGAFDVYAERFSRSLPIFENYPHFKELLNYFAEANCRGCRCGDGRYPNCVVASCVRRKGIDFCFQCDEFPCEKTNFDSHLEKRWRLMNNRMKAVGVEAYYQETEDSPRYV